MARNASLELAPEIGAPGAIQPGRIQSDTYSGFERPLIDNNAERLVSALGYFNNQLGGLHSALVSQDAKSRALAEARDKEAEKLLKEQAVSRYERMKASITSDELLNRIKEGKEDWTADPLIEDIVARDQGRITADNLAKAIDAELQGQTLPLGDPAFNPEKYLLEKSAAFLADVPDGPGVKEFRERLDHLRESLASANEKAKGAAFVAMTEQKAYASITEQLNAGLKAGLTGKSLNDEVRKAWKELGPRMSGGVLGVPNQRLDEMYLDALQEAVKDPATAEQAISVLNAPREGMDGRPLPSLDANPKNNDRIVGLRQAAIATLQAAEKKAIEDQYVNDAATAFFRGDGTFNTLRDRYVTGEKYGVAVDLKANATKEVVASKALDVIRAKSGGQPNYQAEVPIFVRNNVAHPELTGIIEGGFSGVGGTNMRNVGDATPTQLEAIKAGAEAYRSIHDINPVYTANHVQDRTEAFYNAYNILTRSMGYTPDAAAAQIALAYSRSASPEGDRRLGLMQEELNQRIGSINFNEEWWKIFGGRAVNPYDLRQQINDIAKTMSMVEGITAEAAVDRAVDLMKERAVYVNGTAVLGTNLQRDDVPAIKDALGVIFNRHTDALKSIGVSDPAGMSVIPIGNGEAYMVKKADGTGPVTIPVTDSSGKIVGERPLYISYQSISAARNARAAATEAEVQRGIAQRQKAVDEKYRAQYGMTPWERGADNAKRAKEAVSEAIPGLPEVPRAKVSVGVNTGRAVDLLAKAGRGAKSAAESAAGFISGLAGD